METQEALTRLWSHLKKSLKQRPYGWLQEWADIEAEAAALRWYELLVVPGLSQTEECSAVNGSGFPLFTVTARL